MRRTERGLGGNGGGGSLAVPPDGGQVRIVMLTPRRP